MPIIQPGKYNLKNISIVAESGQTIDIKDIFVEMNLTESIFHSTITGHILVTDTLNLISGSVGLPLMGNEILVINMDLPTYFESVPGNSMASKDQYIPKDNPILFVGRITAIKNRNALNDKAQTYLIEFCSEELIISENMKVSKSFKGTPSDIAAKIFSTLNSSSPNPYFEKTINLLSLVIPNWRPLKAIGWLASRSISIVNNSPTFFFFQSLYSPDSVPGIITTKFWYASLDYMLGLEPIKTINFGLANVDQNDNSRFLRAINYEVEQGYDTFGNIDAGLFANSLITHDIAKKEWKKYDHDYYKAFPLWNHNSNGKLYKGVPDSLGNTFNSYPDSKIYMHSTGNATGNNYIEKISNRRSSQVASIDAAVINLLVPGDGKIYSGSKIKFAFKSPESLNNSQREIYDTFYNGDYLVTGISHNFVSSENYRMSMRCAKESLTLNVEDYTRNV